MSHPLAKPRPQSQPVQQTEQPSPLQPLNPVQTVQADIDKLIKDGNALTLPLHPDKPCVILAPCINAFCVQGYIKDTRVRCLFCSQSGRTWVNGKGEINVREIQHPIPLTAVVAKVEILLNDGNVFKVEGHIEGSALDRIFKWNTVWKLINRSIEEFKEKQNAANNQPESSPPDMEQHSVS